MEVVYELCPDLIEKLSTIEGISDKEKTIGDYINLILPKVGVVKDFRNGLEWFNVANPLSLRGDLAGKLVLLDFFTYCCINCLHVLPELKFIEKKYPVKDGLVVVGVHSAKFDAEKGSSSVGAAVQRHEITHPVVNDVSCAMWEELSIACWPTLLLLGPGGYPLFILMGEGHVEVLDLFVGATLKYFDGHNKITHDELPQISLSSHLAADSILKFPGRIALRGDRLAVSDSGHHRVLVVNINTGLIEVTVGIGESGLEDGKLAEAKFNTPQGLVWLDDDINLHEDRVTTVAGTGQMGTDKEGGQSPATSQLLSSPWGLTFDPSKRVLLIAMAGTHQIWGYALHQALWWKGRELHAGSCQALAGSGREENRNGAYPMAAGFAQPSGLTMAGQRLLVADSESSSIRQVNLSYGTVGAVVGGEKDPLNLFSFGDVDGKGTSAKLQHPLDVAWSEEHQSVFVADTFNHKVKKVNLDAGTCETIELVGEAKSLCEPGGVCVDDLRGLLIIADTNNHVIKLVELRNNYNTNKLFLEFPTKVDSCKSKKSVGYVGNVSGKGGELKLHLRARLPKGSKPAPDAPQTWKLKSLPDSWTTASMKGNLAPSDTGLDAEVKLQAPAGTNTVLLELTASIVSCDNALGQCRMHQMMAQVTVLRTDTQENQPITVEFQA
ncbi:hypothetical protein B566_EDAN007765 [Ephemera danica]|nr:hypothetical protein B566_EDAN007765 [Ephemera danica]